MGGAQTFLSLSAKWGGVGKALLVEGFSIQLMLDYIEEADKETKNGLS